MFTFISTPLYSSVKQIQALAILVIALLFSACATDPRAASTPPIKVETLIKSSQSWDGTSLPNYLQGQAEITILRITLQPGARVDWHQHPVINAGVVLSGRLSVESQNGDQLQLNAGDPIIELVNQWHYGLNPGSEPTELIVFYAGRNDLPLAIKKPQEQ
jgi:quercetin dioxygenase-like cupin family protein